MSHHSFPREQTPLTIADVMTKTPHGIAADETVATALERMRTHKIRHLPVRSGGRVVGVLSQRDAELLAGIRELPTVKVKDAMTPDPYCVPPTTHLADVAAYMVKSRIGSALVVDERNTLLGIFTDTDALRLLSQMLKP